jgi:hypothetical protein
MCQAWLPKREAADRIQESVWIAERRIITPLSCQAARSVAARRRRIQPVEGAKSDGYARTEGRNARHLTTRSGQSSQREAMLYRRGGVRSQKRAPHKKIAAIDSALLSLAGVSPGWKINLQTVAAAGKAAVAGAFRTLT